jgi:two-component system chemotaxis response regulator CheV
MVDQINTQADTYLKSGSNELKVLEFNAGDQVYGINILKVSRILSEMPAFSVMPDTHPAVRGVFNEQGHVVPVLDLKYFLSNEKTDLNGKFRVIVTEFFGMLNAILVDNVEAVHTMLWEQVINAQKVMDGNLNPYVISIVRPEEDRMILLLDYETIIMQLTPEKLKTDTNKEELDFSEMNKKVLVAEDSSSIRDMLQMELEDRGFEVLMAHDGQEAYDLLKANIDIGLVISDVEMPRTDGLALTKLIKENAETAHIPVIVYSSIGDLGMKERAKYLKAEEHITKLNLDELFQKIHKHLVHV